MKKREMIKKILALSVAAAMTVSLWVPVYAKKSETVPEIDGELIVDMLSAGITLTAKRSYF